jgi:hypothetical protein
MTRDEIIANIERSWEAWIAALDGIPEAAAVEPGAVGYFSIKDLIAHIAFWDERDLERAHRIDRGEEVQPNDWATMNDQEYEASKDVTLEEATARMLDAHARLSADLRAFDPLDDRLKLDDTWEHYDEHRDEVLAWRASKGI